MHLLQLSNVTNFPTSTSTDVSLHNTLQIWAWVNSKRKTHSNRLQLYISMYHLIHDRKWSIARHAIIPNEQLTTLYIDVSLCVTWFARANLWNGIVNILSIIDITNCTGALIARYT